MTEEKLRTWGKDRDKLAASAPAGTSWRTLSHGAGPGDLWVTSNTVTGPPYEHCGRYRLPTLIEDVDPTADELRAHLEYWDARAKAIAAKLAELRANGFGVES